MKRLMAIVLAVTMVAAGAGVGVVGGAGVALASPDITVYDNDWPGWEAAVGYQYEVEDFEDADLNPGVSFVSDNGLILVDHGLWWDQLDYNGGPTTFTMWTFAVPIYAFGGTWDAGSDREYDGHYVGGPGSNIEVLIDGSWVSVGVIDREYIDVFWGFVSDVPFNQVRLQAYNDEGYTERYTLDDMVYSFAVEVDKDYRYTNVCFEQDNDGDGLFSEDPFDCIDNDLDGLIDEDPAECPLGTSLGTPLPTDADGNYIVEAVVKGDKVRSYNPGQYYAVSTVDVRLDIETLTIGECWCACTDISALSPAKGGGSVVIVEVRDGVACQILDAKSPEVTVYDCGCAATATLTDVPAGTTILMYVKFGPAQKHGDFEELICTNWNIVAVDGEFASASATLKLIEKA